MSRVWTVEEVLALGVRTDLVTACDLTLGCGRTKAYELHRQGQLPFPVLSAGDRIVVPVQPLLELLQIRPGNGEGAVPTAPHAHHLALGGHDADDRTAALQAKPLRSA